MLKVDIKSDRELDALYLEISNKCNEDEEEYETKENGGICFYRDKLFYGGEIMFGGKILYGSILGLIIILLV